MKANESWAVIGDKGHIWKWTIRWSRKEAITRACQVGIHKGYLRKSVWAKLKRTRGCRIIKVQINEVKDA